jgi:hypothetical protein
MIGKITKGKSFYHCIAYCLEDKIRLSAKQKMELSLQDGTRHKNRAEVLEYNHCFGDKWELAEQMKDVQRLNRLVEKPVLHISLRAAPGDQLTREQWIDIGRAAAQEFGIDKNQYICILHHDAQQPHIHLVANRVGYDGKLASDKHDYARMATLCRRQEKKHQLKEVLNPRRYLSQKERLLPRLDQRKMQLKENIRATLKDTRTYAEFERKMRGKGYRIEKGRGIAFEDDKKVRVKGSEVEYSWQTIERTLAKNNRLVLHQENKITRKQARKKVSLGMNHRSVPVQPRQVPRHPGEEVAAGLSKLVHILFRPEREMGMGQDIWEQEERRRLQRKRKRHRHRH